MSMERRGCSALAGALYRRPPITALAELCELVASRSGLYIRYSRGVADDAGRKSIDYESGLQLPGLSASPLDPEPWWTRSLEDWLARRVCRYAHLSQDAPDRRVAWVLIGRPVGRGPDHEPVLELEEAVAIIDKAAIEEAKNVYRRRFDVGRDSTGLQVEHPALRPLPRAELRGRRKGASADLGRADTPGREANCGCGHATDLTTPTSASRPSRPGPG